MNLHSGLRNLHDNLTPIVPNNVMLWMEEKYLQLCGEPELQLLGVLCHRDRDALDVGGNEGCYSLFLRRFAREVVTFEPIPFMARELARKFGNSIDIRCLALSSSNGTTLLHIPRIEGKLVSALASLAKTPATRTLRTHDIVVKKTLLDDVYDGDVGFIKIDVEGHEEDVLIGARATIAACRPRMLIEIEERHAPGALSRIVRRLAGQDYGCYFLHQDCVQPVRLFDPARMQCESGLHQHGCYINNFIFLPLEEADGLVHRMNSLQPRVGLKLRRTELPTRTLH